MKCFVGASLATLFLAPAVVAQAQGPICARAQEAAEEHAEVALLQLDLGFDQAAIAEISAAFLEKKSQTSLGLVLLEDEANVTAAVPGATPEAKPSQLAMMVTQMKEHTGVADAGQAGFAIIIVMLVLLVVATIVLYRSVWVARDEISQVQAYQSFVYRSYGDSMAAQPGQAVTQSNYGSVPKGLPFDQQPQRRQGACC